MICKYLVPCVKKTSLTKKVSTFKNCRFPFLDFLMKIIQQNQPLIYEEIVPTDSISQLFLNLILFQIFLFCLYIRNFVSSLLNYPQKISLQNLKPLFPLILRIFDLECHDQTSLKVAHVFMKFRKLESLHMENKKLHHHKTEAANGGVL